MSLPERPNKIAKLSSEELEGLDEVIYVRPENGASFSLNITAAAVLDLCDGQRSRHDIAGLIASATGRDDAEGLAQVAADVDAIVRQFAKCGLIRTDPGTPD